MRDVFADLATELSHQVKLELRLLDRLAYTDPHAVDAGITHAAHECLEAWTYPLVYLAVCGRDPRRLPPLRELCLGRMAKTGRGAGAVAHGAVATLVDLAQRRLAADA